MDEAVTENIARESLPDILDSIRRAKTHAHSLDGQLMRIEIAYGRERATDAVEEAPKPEPALISMVEDEARELAAYLLRLQEELKRELDLLFGDRA